MNFSLFKYIRTKKANILIILFIINIIFFGIIILRSYFFQHQAIDFHKLPIITKNYKNYKEKFAENDGLVFENQEKIIYNNLMQKSTHKNDSQTEKIRKQIPAHEILKKLTKFQNNNVEATESNQEVEKKHNADVFSFIKE